MEAADIVTDCSFGTTLMTISTIFYAVKQSSTEVSIGNGTERSIFAETK